MKTATAPGGQPSAVVGGAVGLGPAVPSRLDRLRAKDQAHRLVRVALAHRLGHAVGLELDPVQPAVAHAHVAAALLEKSRVQAAEYRNKKHKEMREGRAARQEAMQERAKRDKEYQERRDALKEVALKKMTSGKKLTFDEMKLIFGDAGSD